MRENRPKRIAVVGGGIAGVTAAWALHRSGFEVSLFERCPALGGNAKSFRWQLDDGAVETGVFVLAWPTEYYHSYNQLLELLGVEAEEIPIKYFATHAGGVFKQDGQTDFHRRMQPQFDRWRQLVSWVERTNRWFTPSLREFAHKSLYHVSHANPMNFIPLYWLARAAGISDAFWQQVFVPVHCATFITTKMKEIPAVILPLLEEVVPLERPCRMSTWTRAPRDVFDKMVAGFAGSVYTGFEVTRVDLADGGVAISDRQGTTVHADRVVFACNSTSALNAISRPTWLQRALLSQVEYVDDTDTTFLEATLHTDPTVFPEAHREEILRDFNTYTDIAEDGHLTCTFVLSSHLPVSRGLNQPLCVTFNARKPLCNVQKRIRIPKCNHSLTLKNLAIMSAIRLIQGQNGAYFCGSFTTPEGGHDLSLLSGLVVAHELGADYPLDPDHPAALHDFQQLQRVMLGRSSDVRRAASESASRVAYAESQRPPVLH